MPKHRLSVRFWEHQKKHHTELHQKHLNNEITLTPLVLSRQHMWDNMTANIVNNELSGGPDIIAANPGQIGGGQDIDALISTPQVTLDDTSGA